MSTRPEFYSGRGAIICDLNSKLLEMIYDGVLVKVGPEAAKEFVNFVMGIDRLSATHFLNEFYNFGYRGWVCAEPRATVTLNHIDVGPDNEARLGIGMATIAGVMFGSSDRDETPRIRGDFLRNHMDDLDHEHKDRLREHHSPWDGIIHGDETNVMRPT